MKIVFATNNQHKLSEIRSILGESIEVLSLKDIGRMPCKRPNTSMTTTISTALPMIQVLR